jgi:hypothetical protein
VVANNAKQIVVYASGGCGRLPDRTVDSQPAERVRLAWVDAGGLVGKQSAPVAVRAVK